jgi:hypothetical protein
VADFTLSSHRPSDGAWRAFLVRHRPQPGITFVHRRAEHQNEGKKVWPL